MFLAFRIRSEEIFEIPEHYGNAQKVQQQFHGCNIAGVNVNLRKKRKNNNIMSKFVR